MNCKKCNTILTENDQFCKNCGTPKNEVNVQQNQMSFQKTIEQNIAQPASQNLGQPASQNLGQPAPQNYGQPMQQIYGNSTNYNQHIQKNNTSNYVIIGLIVALVVALIVILIVMFTGDDKSSDLPGKNNNSDISESGVSQSTYKVKFKGFSFNIPDNLIYEEEDGVLAIGNEEDTWVVYIEIGEGNFAQLKANKSQLQTKMQQNGSKVSTPQVKTLAGVEFITMELSVNGQNAIIAYAKANSMYLMGITAASIDNEFDYSLLETIAPIISSASYTGEKSNMKNEFKLDIDKIAEIAK